MEVTDCVFCKKPLNNGDPTTVVGEKGCEGIRKAAEILKKNITTIPGQRVHTSCRRDFCRHRETRRSEHENVLQEISRPLRSLVNAFSFKDHCLFCTRPVKIGANKRDSDYYQVRTFDFQTAITTICLERNDQWGREVLDRIDFGRDLPAVDAVYHHTCSINFRTGRQIPKQMQESAVKTQKVTKGRPVNMTQAKAFLESMQYLEENDDEQITISDLVSKMKDICHNKAYSTKHMKTKLIEHFGSAIVISEINGKHDVVTFKTTASEILHEFYSQPKDEDLNEKKTRIINTAAKLILNDIKSIPTNKDFYPDPNTLSSISTNQEFIPESLRNFMNTLCKGKKSPIRVCSLGQAIMQAVRPKVFISPLQIGLGVQLHHHFASKYLIDVLYQLGFSSSYSEVLKFESSAAVSMKSYLPTEIDDSNIQFSADNVDHNLRTLDGHDTFHGMGMVATVTPGIEFLDPIPRINVTAEEIVKAGQIEVKFYKQTNEIPPLTLKKLRSFNSIDRTENIDTLLKIAWPLHTPRLSWTGFMYTTQDGQFPGQSSICFLPMLDMNPGDLSCIFSTLHFICKETARLDVTPTVTFDQPLYWKALKIIQSESDNSPLKAIVLRLGGFHSQMSFLSSIGHVMQSSGLFETLENIYASNTIDHMMSGKAVSRAVRGHLIVDCALHIIILSGLIDIPILNLNENDENALSVSENDIHGPTIDPDKLSARTRFEKALYLYKNLLEGKATIDDVLKDQNVTDISHLIKQEINALQKYPTAKLWIQYMDMIKVLKSFIKSERTGDWHLYLNSLKDMIPYFATTGHNLYLKSSYCFLQQMDTLEKDHPDIYQKFCEGYHVIRRSNKYWAGISTDLVIEQTLMRSVKTTGGMTRGKGMSDQQRAQWLLSMPACSSLNSAMQKVENVEYGTSNQHKETTNARQERDNKDLMTIHHFLNDRNPFSENPTLRNIETGVTATSDVNVHEAFNIGKRIVDSMEGQDAFTISFKRNMQVKTLNEKSKVKTQGDSINVSPQLLFQRLITVARNFSEDVSKIFEYELSNYPSSMFESSGVMREPQKSNLAEALWTLGDCSTERVVSTSNVQYVLDGGSLLHRIPWAKGVTFENIINTYVEYVRKKYGDAIIVFDGYDNEPSTKDHTHQRRTKGLIGTKVYFNKDTPFKSKKEIFLGNVENKQNFIMLLSKHFQENGCKTVHAESDADILIVQTAIECSKTIDTVLVGEDTDLLVLLCYHMDARYNKLVFQSEMKSTTSKRIRIWDINETKTVLGPDLCHILPFVHAISGCDTTSRIFGVGKGQTVKKASTDLYFKQCANNFMNTKSTEEACRIGEEAMVCLLNGVPHEGLNMLRFRKFTSKVMTSSKFVEVHTLPPTSNSARFHILRVFYQVKEWICEAENMKATDFGWSIENNMCTPIKSTLPPAPEELLKTIYCKCKTNCETKRCNCRKHGLECSTACSECRENTCCNMPVVELQDSDSDE